MDVYLLWHARDLLEEIDVKLLGVYSTQEKAEEAKRQALTKPGFRDHPDGFEISKYEIDQSHWTTGFVSVPYGEV